MLHMFLQVLAVDDYVVKVYDDKLVEVVVDHQSKVAGAFVNPKGMTNHSNAPYLVTHAVFVGDILIGGLVS